MRGLKYITRGFPPAAKVALLVSAWIEIDLTDSLKSLDLVALLVSAWIEIVEIL